ncbi:MAG: aromatic acid exporter family protein, partial [Muribaculaceae bacterium]|nr:aromatic acid exporter family protein [Muribaculaceae bacterium]
MLNTTKWKRALLLAGKIALGSSLAIYTAELLHLQYAASAGIVTLLTVVTTQKETLRLSVARIATFLIAALIAMATFLPIRSEWLAFGLYVFLVTLISELLGWRATVSTNAVIGTHFLMNLDFSPTFFLNEFQLVLIGIMYAFVLNLFQDN